MSNNLHYINKQNRTNKETIRLKNGATYTLNTLEKYALEGFLDGTECEIIELLLAGKILYRDFYNAKIENITANDPSRLIVDGREGFTESDTTMSASDKFNSAIQSLPKKTLSIVTRVCCDNKDIIVTGNKEQRIYEAQQSLELLKLGLTELVKHYKSLDIY